MKEEGKDTSQLEELLGKYSANVNSAKDNIEKARKKLENANDQDTKDAKELLEKATSQLEISFSVVKMVLKEHKDSLLEE
jgi:hypothetical protein